MSEKVPVSILIMTKNEELNIAQCLESISWTDEIFVVDSGSTDRTIEIAKRCTDKIFYYPFENFGMALVEAMACGIPAVVTDKVGIHKEVKKHNAGIIVEANREGRCL